MILSIRNDNEAEKISPMALVGIKASFKRHYSMDDIANYVADYYQVPIDKLKSKSRESKYRFPRQICQTLMYHRFNYTLKQIANYFNQDHTTVINSRERIRDLMQTEPETRRQYNYIKNTL